VGVGPRHGTAGAQLTKFLGPVLGELRRVVIKLHGGWCVHAEASFVFVERPVARR
jgi:hypothetical protein